MKKIVLIGFGGHAKSIVDSIESAGVYKIAGFLDVDREAKQQYRGYSVIGTDDDAKDIYENGVKYAVISIGYMGSDKTRNTLYEYYRQIGFEFPAIIDKTAVIATDCSIGQGVFVAKNAVVNANAVIGNMAIVNSGVIIEHDVNIGDFSHIAVGATICGGCIIGENCLIGANSTVIEQLNIGGESIVGAGAVVTRDVESKTTVMGVPAK